MKRLQAILLTLACLLATSSPALADVSPGDMQVLARALSFMTKPLAGDVDVGIVYSPRDPQSMLELESVRRIIGRGLRVGGVTLKAVPVPLGAVGSAQVGLLFLTAGLGARGQAVAQASRARRIPCATTDLTQVSSGVCAIGIRAEPRVEILVNRAAAAAEGTAFSTVFSLMITEF
jgi:hypothetical protein